MNNKFKCPECSHDVLVEVLMEAIVYSQIYSFYSDDTPEYAGPPEIDNGRVDYFCCEQCGFEILDEYDDSITEYDELFYTLKERGWLQGGDTK